jgi:hypothetical protein
MNPLHFQLKKIKHNTRNILLNLTRKTINHCIRANITQFINLSHPIPKPITTNINQLTTQLFSTHLITLLKNTKHNPLHLIHPIHLIILIIISKTNKINITLIISNKKIKIPHLKKKNNQLSLPPPIQHLIKLVKNINQNNYQKNMILMITI